MKRLTNHAEGVEKEHPTAHNRTGASAESAYNSESTSDRSGEKVEKRHSFSRKLAREIQAKKIKAKANGDRKAKAGHGVHEALLLKYLAFRVRTSKKVIGGKKWFYITIDDLTSVFPYLGYTTICDIVHRLESLDYIEIGNFNRRKKDTTFWYHVPTEISHAAEDDLIYFNSALCPQLTVPQAALLANFQYWINQCEERGVAKRVNMSPIRLSEMLPFSIDTIKRGLEVLESSFIEKLSTTDPIYGPRTTNSSANPNNCGADPNSDGANPNEIGADPNDVTSYVTISNLLETSSKEQKPTAFDCETPNDETNNGHEGIHSSEERISPIPGEQQRETMSPAPIFPAFPEPLYLSDHKRQQSSTCDIFGEAKDVANGCDCPISSYRELRSYSHHLDAEVESWQDDVKSILTDRVMEVACSFLRQQTECDICDWNVIQDPESLFEAIAPSFTQFFRETIKSLDESTSLYLILFGGTLECVIGAFLWSKANTGYTHGITTLQRLVYRITLAIFRVVEDSHSRAVEQEFKERRREFASKDEYKECDADLAPAEKMRVFRNALNSRNQVGWIFYDQSHRTLQIQIKRGLEKVQRLFELNTDLTPYDLLKIMDGCIDAYRKQPAPPKRFHHGVRWHARHGRKLEIFASYFSTIVKQLGMASPVNVYLNDAQMNVEQKEAEPEVALAA